MKKFWIPFITFVSIIIIIGFIAWFNIPNIIANILTREFSVLVTVGNVNLSKNNLKVQSLNVETPTGSKTSSSFYSEEINVSSTLKNINNQQLTIDSFTLKNNIISIEFYNESGSDNNWVRILNKPTKPEKVSNRKYLIKKLTLNNISLVLTKPNGQKQNFPTIEKLEFYNISDETGFPIEEIEKAITEIILNSVFQQFNLLNLLKESSPYKVLEKVFPFFNKEK